MDKVQGHLNDAKNLMTKAIQHLEAELGKLRAGKASPAMVDGLKVDYYGNLTPLSQVANISTPDPRTIAIQPWEKQMVAAIEQAIKAANLGLNPQNDGAIVRINIPPLTEERRKELTKQVKQVAEHARVSVRNVRRDINEHIKKLSKDGLPEDELKDAEAKVQQLTNEFIAKVDKHAEAKEKEIMTV